MNDELIHELRLLREELIEFRKNGAAFANNAPNQGTQEIGRNGDTINNSLLGTAGLILQGRSPKEGLQLTCILLFPFLMALTSTLKSSDPISRFDFWLMIPVMSIGIGFYNAIFLTNIKDRSKVKSRWDRHREFVNQWMKRNEKNISMSPSPIFRRKIVLGAGIGDKS